MHHRVTEQIDFIYIYLYGWIHYSGGTMGAMASQITSLTLVYSTVYSGADQRKHQSSASLAFGPVTGEFPAQMASNAENVSIWWRHQEFYGIFCIRYSPESSKYSGLSRAAVNLSEFRSSIFPQSVGLIFQCRLHSLKRQYRVWSHA